MTYDEAVYKLLLEDGVEESTMMKNACLRYKGDFMGMMWEKEDVLVIKVSPERVNELIAEGKGQEFNLTKKRFKEWVMIPIEFEDEYESLIYEALEYAKSKN
ncbi:hypothetical protein J2755_000993 [Methanohalophilus levihalophilus]|uniref:hypothetical protein n=1 Tax=Methanohalophilus levihalophilus TaxID=1431282 RepID=UPI001AE5A344|nr:hypothetical protein [Methanohalophilus levihalophilus]MBP2030059.1 hypothetical protein [Methanohalophilus levihalophilus]